LFGRGLLTASRFEILTPIGREETSTIHSTWVEALVGTGLVGTALLAASLLVVLRRAIRSAVAPIGRVVPLVVLTVIAVRSVTGTTFEASGRSVLIVLAFALILDDRHTWITSRVAPTRVPPRPMPPTADAKR
jgi:O-antigen ligase